MLEYDTTMIVQCGKVKNRKHLELVMLRIPGVVKVRDTRTGDISEPDTKKQRYTVYINALIRQGRHAKKISQIALAKKLHVHVSAVAKWEHCTHFPSPWHCGQLIDLFGDSVRVGDRNVKISYDNKRHAHNFPTH